MTRAESIEAWPRWLAQQRYPNANPNILGPLAKAEQTFLATALYDQVIEPAREALKIAAIILAVVDGPTPTKEECNAGWDEVDQARRRLSQPGGKE